MFFLEILIFLWYFEHCLGKKGACGRIFIIICIWFSIIFMFFHDLSWLFKHFWGEKAPAAEYRWPLWYVFLDFLIFSWFVEHLFLRKGACGRIYMNLLYVVVMFWWCVGHVLVMFQLCFNDVLVMCWWCFRYVLGMFWGCVRDVLGMF